MSDEPALLRAILAHPDEDTPRLAYADWLQEHGTGDTHARAEFIRLQIELATGADERRQSLLETRCAELLRASSDNWLEPFRAASAVGTVRPEFWRGFVSRVTDVVPIDPSWLARLSEVCPVQEVTFGLTYGSDTTGFTALADCPVLGRIRKLNCAALPQPHIAALLKSPHLTGLKTLRLHSNCGDVVEALARSAPARGLRELWAGQHGAVLVPERGIGALMSAELPALTTLHLNGAGGNEGAQRLSAAFAGHGGQALHISDHALSWPGALDTIETTLAGRLGTLSLVASPVLRADELLARSAGHTLHVEGFREYGDRIAAWLASVLPPGRFARLRVVGCQISRVGARTFANWEGLADLKFLDLSHNWIGDIGAAHLAESPYLANVEQLLVAHNDITRKGKEVLKKRFGRRVRIS